MNKRFSTLLAAFAAFTVVASAQTKFVMLTDNAAGVLSWSKDVPTVDSVKVKPIASLNTIALNDSALWEVKIVRVETGNDTICTFTNKATKKLLSFAKSADATTRIAAGVSEFVFKENVAIYAKVADNKIIAYKDQTKLLNSLTGATALAIDDNEVNVAFKNVKELTGNSTSFKFDFKGKAANLFTETELIPTLAPGTNAKFKFQVVGKEVSANGTKPAQYITIDTASYGGTVKASKFQLDSLLTETQAIATNRYNGNSNSGLQSFQVWINLNNDSIFLLTDSVVTFNTTGAYSIVGHGANTNDEYVVGYKTFANSTEVLTTDSAQIIAPFISITKGTPVALPGGEGVYSLMFKGTGGNAASNGKYLVYNGSGYAYTASAATKFAPYTQVYVKDNGDGTYSMQSRESMVVAPEVGTKGETTGKAVAPTYIENTLIYTVKDAAAGVYAIDNGDTLLFTKLDVDMANKSLGYKFYSKEEMSAGSIAFNLISKASDEVYLSTTKDSLVQGAKTTFDGALQLRLSNVSDKDGVMDTVYYGAADLGDNLMRVSYSMERPYKAASKFYAAADGGVKMAVNADSVQRYFFVADINGEGYQIVKSNMKSVAIDSAIVVNATNLAVAYDKPVAGSQTIFAIESAPAPVYAKVAPRHYKISKGYDMLTDLKGAAKFMRVNDELKAGKTEDDFSLFIDTAYVNRGADNNRYGYYIYKGATVKNDTIRGNALTVGALNSFNQNGVAGDSAMFAATTVVKDTIWYASSKATDRIKVTEAANKSVMMFKVVEDGYVITPMNAPSKTLAVVNDVVIFSSQVIAQPIVLEAASAPVGNEDISATTIKVVAGQGNVTVYGAAGKKVTISDILGKTTTSIATSDSHVFPATRGVVIISVEGEAAVKAIVK